MNRNISLLLALALSFGCAKKAEEVSPAPTEAMSASPPATLTTTVAAAEWPVRSLGAQSRQP
jgi:hypothetical protein